MLVYDRFPSLVVNKKGRMCGAEAEGWDRMHLPGKPRSLTKGLLYLSLELCRGALPRARWGGRKPPGAEGSRERRPVGALKQPWRAQSKDRQGESTTAGAVRQTHRLRVCNAVEEEGRGESSALATQRLAGPCMGETVSVKFMAQNKKSKGINSPKGA